VGSIFGDAPNRYFTPSGSLLARQLKNHFVYAIHPLRIGFTEY
jgi:hypothetical protein